MKFIKHLAALITLCAVLPGIVFGGTLAEIPLNLRGNVPSNVLFDISVEWPTAITAAYNGDRLCAQANQFEGLFDPNLCYDYPADHFVPASCRSQPQTHHACAAGQWSGNFLNWATMTGLDAFRYATTGGNRSTDTATTDDTRTHLHQQPGQSCFPEQDLQLRRPSRIRRCNALLRQHDLHDRQSRQGHPDDLDGHGIRHNDSTTSTRTNATTTCNVSWTATSPYCSQFKATIGGITSTGTCATWSGTGIELVAVQVHRLQYVLADRRCANSRTTRRV